MKKLPRYWTHTPFRGKPGGMTRDEAIEAMHDYYDRKRGRRRTPSREAFEVYRAAKDRIGGWVLYVRRIREKGEPIEPGESAEFSAVVQGPRVKGSSRRVRCPVCTFWRIPGKTHVANGKPCNGLEAATP